MREETIRGTKIIAHIIVWGLIFAALFMFNESWDTNYLVCAAVLSAAAYLRENDDERHDKLLGTVFRTVSVMNSRQRTCAIARSDRCGSEPRRNKFVFHQWLRLSSQIWQQGILRRGADLRA
jgi:hypothetical protein